MSKHMSLIPCSTRVAYRAQVVESMAFFLDDMDRIMAKNYLATAQDMLHVRIRSSGVLVDK